MCYLYEVSKEEDFEPLYTMKCQKDAVKWSGFAEAPDRNVFYNYFITKILENPQTHVFYLIDPEQEDNIIGYKQYDSLDNIHVEIRGTIIKRKYQGCGYNEVFSDLLGGHFRKMGYKHLITSASEKNKASIMNLEYCGFKRTNEYSDVEMKAMNGEIHRFYKWIKEIK